MQREDANQEGLTGDDYSEEEENACCVVCDLSLTFFRGRLVEHFDISFHTPNLGVVWPRSRGKEPRVL